jgi:aromatic-L-amino-acid/L-tryptophan decarboxylase
VLFEQTTDSQAHEGSPLALDPDVMRQLGYRTIDMLVDRLTGPQGPVVNAECPAELHRRLSMPAPERPAPFEEILRDLERDVLPYVARLAHPGYLAYIPGEGTWPGALGDLISSALNIDACWWLGASGPAALELAVLDWFRQWVGYPAEAAGVLVSGGSAANLTALACAREALLGEMDARAVLYMSDQAHSSLARSARVLGFGPDQVRVILSDDVGRMRPDGLEGAIAADGAGGRRPLLVVANAGSTAVGAIDPFAELSRICREHGAWLHVDGAYGAFACLTERGSAALAGMELADSITLDPHKWLYQPGRGRRPAGARRRPAAALVRDPPQLPEGHRGGRSRGQLLRPGRAADAQLPGAETVDLAALLRRGRLPAGDRPLHRPGPPTPSGGWSGRRSSS